MKSRDWVSIISVVTSLMVTATVSIYSAKSHVTIEENRQKFEIVLLEKKYLLEQIKTRCDEIRKSIKHLNKLEIDYMLLNKKKHPNKLSMIQAESLAYLYLVKSERLHYLDYIQNGKEWNPGMLAAHLTGEYQECITKASTVALAEHEG